MRKEKPFEVARKPLFHTRARAHYYRNPRMQSLNRRSVVEQSFHFQQEGHPFLDPIDNVDYGAPEKLNKTYIG